MISLVVPVYKSSLNIAPLVAALSRLNEDLAGELEAVFVVDGSPDDSYLQLSRLLPAVSFRSQLLLLSRNFGSFSAIRAGLEAARGDRFAVMAADLQEPPELVLAFDRHLRDGSADIVLGLRASRDDPWLSKLMSATFWALYRRFVMPDVPPGGVDAFACNAQVRAQILRLAENRSSLVGLLLWIGFRRSFVPYTRRAREAGESAWSMRKKIAYLLDSVFSFTDLPIRILTRIGSLGLLLSLVFIALVIYARITDAIDVPGYAATVITVTFFGALNCLGLGIIGSYVWRSYENTKGRPNYIVARSTPYGSPALGQGALGAASDGAPHGVDDQLDLIIPHSGP